MRGGAWFGAPCRFLQRSPPPSNFQDDYFLLYYCLFFLF